MIQHLNHFVTVCVTFSHESAAECALDVCISAVDKKIGAKPRCSCIFENNDYNKRSNICSQYKEDCLKLTGDTVTRVVCGSFCLQIYFLVQPKPCWRTLLSSSISRFSWRTSRDVCSCRSFTQAGSRSKGLMPQPRLPSNKCSYLYLYGEDRISGFSCTQCICSSVFFPSYINQECIHLKKQRCIVGLHHSNEAIVNFHSQLLQTQDQPAGSTFSLNNRLFSLMKFQQTYSFRSRRHSNYSSGCHKTCSGNTFSHKSRRTRQLLWILTVVFTLWHSVIVGLPSAHAQGLIGTVSTCDKEGEEIEVPNITDNPCIKCVCRNNQVECEPKPCRNVEGCHAILFDQPSKMCCETCKGCWYQGVQYNSGDTWTDKRDSCKQLSCRAGVVTMSRVQCFTHCYNTAHVPGHCCPVCKGCYFRGHVYKESESFKLSTDVCTTCTCRNNHLICEREQCSVLNCPPEVIFQPKDECCPQCKGQRLVFDVPAQCYFAKSVYRRNQQFTPDQCSKCVCKVVDKSSGTSVCETETCPVLDCPEAERQAVEGSQCCLRCQDKRICMFEGKAYKHKEEWRPNICVQCVCDDGVTYCQRERCRNSLWCPQGYRLLLTEDECCPKCVEHDAVCSVFGDPHYRTFDGLMYSFQGTCKYILARDCSKNEFLIKVKNGIRFSSGFAWTQMLVVFVHKHRISMLQNSVVKIDKKRTQLPYTKQGMFSVSKDGELVKLTTNIGLEVTWDGDSFLEVTVTTKFKHRLCGLCGNYNGIKSDDLIGRNGTIYMNGDDYGHSWRIGSTRACKARPHFQETQPLCEKDLRAKQRAHRVCSVFYTRTFTKCRQRVPVDVYVSSCIIDMCDCPEGHYCACEAIRAYTSQCARQGFKDLLHKVKNCQAPESCPQLATKVDCSEVCPRTCKSPQNKIPCPDKCLGGCLCEDGKVLHNGKCVHVSKCPANR